MLIVSGSVGAGHDGAARELSSRLRGAGVDVDVRDYLEAVPRLARRALRDGYTLSVGRAPAVFDWFFHGIERDGPVRSVVLAFCRLAERRLQSWVNEHDYAVVVSTYPLASQTLGELRADGRLTAPVLTYLTDPAAHRSWIHTAVDLHLTVTAAAARQARRDYGVDMLVAGPLVPACFSEDVGGTGLTRADLGLPDDRLVALLVAGSLGLGDVLSSVRDVLAEGVAPLVLCGRNERLRRRLSTLPGCVALGWRDDVADLMRLSDVLVHNAGGLSFTEAYVRGLPAVSYRCIPGHGQANARVLAEADLAPWARTPVELGRALRAQSARPRLVSRHLDPAHLVLAMLTPVDSHRAAA